MKRVGHPFPLWRKREKPVVPEEGVMESRLVGKSFQSSGAGRIQAGKKANNMSVESCPWTW